MKPYKILIATTVAAAGLFMASIPAVQVPQKAFAAEKMIGKPLTDFDPKTVEGGKGAIGKATVRKLEKLDEKTVLHYEVTGPLTGNQAGAVGLVQSGKALERKSLKFVGKNREAYSYVQEFSPLDQEQPVRLTT
ncbi:hypothetical protein QJ48_32095 [Paenibacillus sp. A3]|uniref:hypothetical protein n=1 Tax=Paenibacillus sp. A3 TaxID=1337054 RepID=UPI0006D56C07|nr:hypothetical protein [Paenibacillus sp. A3]KPV55614.1 hypothetical protein QJ48_32095 [Paenibacillus sp. A3]